MKLIIVIYLIIIIGTIETTQKRIICYYSSWAINHEGKGKFDISNIDVKLCTHLIYAYIEIFANGQITSNDDHLDVSKAQFTEIRNLKKVNPNLKILVGLGGNTEGSSKIFSDIAKKPLSRQTLILNSIKFITDRNLDGMELVWSYPGSIGGNATIDKKNYVKLVKEYKQQFAVKKLIISAKVIGIHSMAKTAYNIREISKHLDFINIICYDFYGSWKPEIGIHSQLYESANKTSIKKQPNVDNVISFWIRKGAPPSKINLGIGFHGRTYKLADSNLVFPGANHKGGGLPGPYSKYSGVICYNELCELFKNQNWYHVWDDKSLSPYAFTETEWVSYENVKSVELKARYANEKMLGGVMISNLECDDFSGKFSCEETDENYPLLRTVNSVLSNGATFPTFEYSVEMKVIRQNLKYNSSISVFENVENFYEE